jgi:hypothetical protein
MQPTLSYLDCGTPRSGTSLLCATLKNTGIAGNPGKYFWRGNAFIIILNPLCIRVLVMKSIRNGQFDD